MSKYQFKEGVPGALHRSKENKHSRTNEKCHDCNEPIPAYIKCYAWEFASRYFWLFCSKCAPHRREMSEIKPITKKSRNDLPIYYDNRKN